MFRQDGLSIPPVLILVMGGLTALFVVRRWFEPAYANLLVLVTVVCLSISLILFSQDSSLALFALFLGGFGFFLLYAVTRRYRTQVKRNWLRNRRLNVEGVLEAPNRLRADRINGEATDALFYVQTDRSRWQFDQYRSSGRIRINATGVVRWNSTSDGFKRYLEAKGFDGHFLFRRIHSVDVLRPPVSSPIESLRSSTDAFLEDGRVIAPTSTALIQALLTGEKHFSNQVSQLLRRFGIYHLFVISGLHIGVLLVCLWWILPGVHTTYRAVLVGSVLVGYVSFLGWPLSASRALVMSGVGGLSMVLNRRSSLFEILTVTVLLFMLVNPAVVLRVGFQLSVAAVLGIVLVRPTVRNAPPVRGLSLLLVSIGAFIGVLPVILFHFGYVSPVALVGGFLGTLIFPLLVTLLVLQFGFLWVEWSALARSVEYGLSLGVQLLGELLNHWSLVLELPAVSVTGCLLITGLLVGLLWYRTPWAVRGALAIVLVVVLFLGRRGSEEPIMTLAAAGDRPYAVLRTERGRTGLYVPPGTRLDAYTFHSIERHLESLGIHHLDVFASDYTRRMMRRVDPAITIGTVVVHWKHSKPDNVLPWTVRYGPARLTTASFSLKFEGAFEDKVPVRAKGLAAFTSTASCLVIDPAVLESGSFEVLKESGCSIFFLKETPVRFAASGEVTGRGIKHPRSFSSRVLDRLSAYY